jgi:hypothetical protein
VIDAGACHPSNLCDGSRSGSVGKLKVNNSRQNDGLRLSKKIADRAVIRRVRVDRADQQCRELVGVLAVFGRVLVVFGGVVSDSIIVVAGVRAMTVKVVRNK